MDYVPHCLICGKQLELHLHGRIYRANDNVAYHKSALHFRLKSKDEYLIGNNKKHSFAINPLDNEISSGKDTVNDLLVNRVMVNKKCYTCYFSIVTEHPGSKLVNYKKFPPLTLKNEEIYFTRKRGKPVSIYQNYHDDSTLRTNIVIDRRTVPSIYMDFSKFKNLDHLNERISTILTFS